MSAEDYYGDIKPGTGSQSPMTPSRYPPNMPLSETDQQQYQYQYQYPPYGESYQQQHPPPPSYSYYQQPPPAQYQYASPPSTYPQIAGPVTEAPASDDRGILGALGGGAAGAYAGHQVNHGVLGTIGGAIAGSLAEDAIKNKTHVKKDDENPEKEKKSRKWGFHRRHSSSSSSSSSSDSDSEKESDKKENNKASKPKVGNFSATSVGISLQGNYELVASCRQVSGAHKESRLPLNSVLTNEFGHFKWRRGGNFGASARNARLNEGGRVLEAELANGRGGWDRDWVRLDERIANQNGNLVFMD
ncbi:CVNH domain-containing protein [Aspergillus cavernicola]|uniref:CVNH domain-containing protein n=1 Tax=Aspergillus cavernicola TaxID=176166 RepID=A0ABR4IJV0_9EURO